MNNRDLMKIGFVLFVVVILLILVIRRRDNFQYPPGQTYEPTGAPWSRQPGNGGQPISQPYTNALVSGTSENIETTAVVPLGGIIMWSGTSAPYGWGLCNGSSYTNTVTGITIQSPDLTGRFVVGSGQSSNSPMYVTQYNTGDTGGEEYHQLTVEEMPAHAHTGAWELCFQCGISGGGSNGDYESENVNTGSVGGDPNNNNATLPHNNMPPYYALAYIIKYI